MASVKALVVGWGWWGWTQWGWWGWGYQYDSALSVTAQAYPITVWAGWAETSWQTIWNNGTSSIFSTITANGWGWGWVINWNWVNWGCWGWAWWIYNSNLTWWTWSQW